MKITVSFWQLNGKRRRITVKYSQMHLHNRVNCDFWSGVWQEMRFCFVFGIPLLFFLISYQEFLQIVAISTHWPLSFPVTRFRLCYLIGGIAQQEEAEKKEREIKMWPTLWSDLLGPLLWYVHFNRFYCFGNFCRLCTATLSRAGRVEVSCVHFKGVHELISSGLTKACPRSGRENPLLL